MKKIMFNDRYGLTEAVLSGRKTQTRRIYKTPANAYGGLEVENGNIISFDANGNEFVTRPKYTVGEVVAVAQAYRDTWQHTGYMTEIEAKQCAGYSNKMFVRADLMPHHIRITDVRVERLQDISDEDCIKEGVVQREHIIPTSTPQVITQYHPCQYMIDCIINKVGWGRSYDSPREAYADLIEKVSGMGLWHSNPYVFVYDFELIK